MSRFSSAATSSNRCSESSRQSSREIRKPSSTGSFTSSRCFVELTPAPRSIALYAAVRMGKCSTKFAKQFRPRCDSNVIEFSIQPPDGYQKPDHGEGLKRVEFLRPIRALTLHFLAADHDRIGRRIMLHLDTGTSHDATRALLLKHADPTLPAEPRQRRIR